MALTREDLQAIRELVREEVRTEVREEVRTEVREVVREEVRTEVRKVVQEEIAPINTRLDKLEEEQRVIRDSQLKVELELYPRISAALDGFSYNRDRHDSLSERVAALEDTADRHDTRIGILELTKAK